MTAVQICNMALGRVRAQPISDLETDKTKSATTCRIFYEPLRDALLRGYPWAFSITRQALATVDIDNLSTYDYIYQLPTSPKCLRIISLLNEAFVPTAFPYDREGDYLYSNEPSAVLLYVGQITDPNKFDALFVDAFVWRLASEIVGPITGESSTEPWAKYNLIITEAFGADSQERIEPAVPSPRWTDERFDRSE
jgi:hypothetical protein